MLPSESDELEPSKVHVCPLHANVNAAEGRLVGTPLHGLHVGPYPASPTGPQAHSPVTVTKEINEWKPFGFSGSTGKTSENTMLVPFEDQFGPCVSPSLAVSAVTLAPSGSMMAICEPPHRAV